MIYTIYQAIDFNARKRAVIIFHKVLAEYCYQRAHTIDLILKYQILVHGANLSILNYNTTMECMNFTFPLV